VRILEIFLKEGRGGGNYDKNKKAEQNLKLNIYTNEKRSD
jgi:hypothetical protein